MASLEPLCQREVEQALPDCQRCDNHSHSLLLTRAHTHSHILTHMQTLLLHMLTWEHWHTYGHTYSPLHVLTRLHFHSCLLPRTHIVLLSAPKEVDSNTFLLFHPTILIPKSKGTLTNTRPWGLCRKWMCTCSAAGPFIAGMALACSSGGILAQNFYK